MKKLKFALILLLAMLMSVALFACGGDPEEEPNPDPGPVTGDKTINTVLLTGVTSLSFTDSDTKESAWDTALATLSLRVNYTDNTRANLTAADCTVNDSSVQWQTVGSYTATLTPKENNANNRSVSVPVEITHDFVQDANDPTLEICAHDQATRITKALTAEYEIKGFHDGITTLADSTGSINHFGSLMTPGNSREDVPTATVGRLEKGMSITLKGTAVATASDKAWFFPILGFADSSENGKYSSTANGAGSGIFVRNEGWVLENGVGSPRMLAGLVGSSAESGNYGSHPTDTAAKPDGYVVGTQGGPSYDLWVPWHVYSTGTQCATDAYTTEQNVEFTWTYSNVEERPGYGLITLTNTMYKADGTFQSSLVSRALVPDSTLGYYDALLHGEYVKMTFSRIQTVQTRTLEDFEVLGLSENAKTTYLENEFFDFSSIQARALYVQDNGQWTADTMFDVQAKVGGDWISLKNFPLTSDMTEFRVTRTVGQNTLSVTETKEGTSIADLFTVLPNAVQEAYGYPVNGLPVNGTIYSIDFSSDNIGGSTYAVLALSGAASSNGTAKYVAFRIWTREGGKSFAEDATPELKCGDTKLANDDYTITIGADGKYADVVIYLKDVSALKENGVVISGLIKDENAVPVMIDLSDVTCTEVLSQVTKTSTIYLDAGGTATIVYTMDADTYALLNDYTTLTINGTSAEILYSRFNGKVGNVEVTVAQDAEAHTLTVTLTLPKISVANVTGFTVQLGIGPRGAVAVEATDTIYYDTQLAKTSTVGIYDEDSDIYVEAIGTTLYFIKGFQGNDIKSENILVNNSIMLSVNTGTAASKYLLDLQFKCQDGAFVVYDEIAADAVSGTLYVFGGAADNSRDYDYGAVAVVTVDLTKLTNLGEIKAPYFFELNGEAEPTFIYKVTASNTIEKVNVDVSELDIAALEEGDCYHVGYVGYLYENADQNFYVGVREIGGKHHFVSNVCDHCGATQTGKTWGSAISVTLNQNEVLYVDGGQHTGSIVGNTTDFYRGFTIRIQVSGGSTFYLLRPDAFAMYVPNNQYDYTNNTIEALEVGTTEILYGTMGTAEQWNTYRNNSQAHFYGMLMLENGTLTYTAYYYTDPSLVESADGLFFSYRYSFIDNMFTNDSYTLQLLSDGCSIQNGHYATSGLLINGVTNYNVTGSAITYKDTAFALTSNVTFTNNGIANNAINVAIAGDAVKLSNEQKTALGTEATHYVAFTMELSHALTDWLVNLDGVDGYVKIDGTNVHVILAIDGLKNEALVDFTNYKAEMFQGDMKFDLSQIVASDITTAVTGNTLTLASGEVTITYTGAVTDDMTLTVNKSSLALSVINAGETLLDSLKVKSLNIDANQTVVVLEQANVDFTQKVSEYVVTLNDANGKLLSRSAIGFDGGLLPEELIEGKLVLVNGNVLTIVYANVASGSNTLYLNANKGPSTEDKTLIRNYNITTNVSSAGVAAYNDSSSVLVKAEGTKVVYTADLKILALTLDLSALNISAADAYGFELLPSATATVGEGYTVYTVAAGANAYTAATVATGAELTDVTPATCTEGNVKGYVHNNMFYYGLQTSAAAGHDLQKVENPDDDLLKGFNEVWVCSRDCGMVKYIQSGAEQYIGTGTPGEGGYGGYTVLSAFGTITKGGLIEVSGTHYSTNASNWNSVGVAFNTTEVFRTDNFILSGAGNASPTTGGKDFDLFKVASTNTYPKAGSLDNVAYKATLDWTNESKIVLTFVIGTETKVYTITAKTNSVLADEYTISFVPDNAMVVATALTQIVTNGNEPISPLHVHKYSEETDRCPVDNVLDPSHVHEYNNETGLCRCGDVDPSKHTHTYDSNFVCTVCNAWVDIDSLDALTTADAGITWTNNSSAAWWANPTSELTFANTTVLKITFTAATNLGLVFNVHKGETYYSYRPDTWKDDVNEYESWGDYATAESVKSNRHNLTAGMNPGFNGTNVTCYLWRNGDAYGFYMGVAASGSSEITYFTYTYGTGLTTDELQVRIDGYLNGCSNFQAWRGTMPTT